MFYRILMESGNLVHGFAMPKEEHTIVERPDMCNLLLQSSRYGGDGFVGGALCNTGVGVCFVFSHEVLATADASAVAKHDTCIL